MHISILGKRWDLRFSKTPADRRGDCDAPTTPHKQIRISDKLEGEEELEVIIHELRHAASWHVDEDYITREARDIARVLWRLGYRRST